MLPLPLPVCQMAGGFDSPDIHQCLAVRCSRSSDLTCRLVQQNSFPLLGTVRTNDAAKWSSVSLEPNKNAANMARQSNTDVSHPGLGKRKRKKNVQSNFDDLLNSGSMCPICIKHILKQPLWLSFFLGSGDICNLVRWNIKPSSLTLRVSNILMFLLTQLCPREHL